MIQLSLYKGTTNIFKCSVFVHNRHVFVNNQNKRRRLIQIPVISMHCSRKKKEKNTIDIQFISCFAFFLSHNPKYAS